MNSCTKTLIVLAGVAAGLVATAAPAATASVPYRAYELENPAGVRVVMRRIERQVATACGGGQTLQEKLEAKNCAIALTGQIVAQIDRPALTALHQGRTDVKVASSR